MRGELARRVTPEFGPWRYREFLMLSPGLELSDRGVSLTNVVRAHGQQNSGSGRL
jgi:hypothetical protein